MTTLYDNEPLSAWELTAKLVNYGRQSLHATLSKRLRILENKGYVRRRDKKWYLRFKGIIAVLLIQRTPKMWNPKWKEIFGDNTKVIEEHSAPLLGLDKATVQDAIKKLNLTLDDFDAWVNLSKKVKELMEKGVINLDIIKEETLLVIIIMETKTLEELSAIFRNQLVKK